MSENSRPVLVTGSHRSGTTWVGRTISQHPGVRYIHEPFNVSYPNQDLGLKLDVWFTHFESSDKQEEITRTFNRLLLSSPTERALEACKTAGMDIKTPARFCKHLITEYLISPQILVKDPIAILSAGWLYDTYNFKVICMIRNPYAFIGSLKVAGWDLDIDHIYRQDKLMAGPLRNFAPQIEAMCTQGDSGDYIDRCSLLWNILHYAILEYQNQYPDWLFLKHEAIAEDPGSEFQKIFDYLYLDMNPKIQKYIEKYTSSNNPKESPSSAYQPRDSRLVLQTYKQRLTSDEIDRIKEHTSDIASHFYTPDSTL